jgi:hypothetical protein
MSKKITAIFHVAGQKLYEFYVLARSSNHFQNILTNKYEAWRRHTIQVVDQVVDQVVETFFLELVLTLYRR